VRMGRRIFDNMKKAVAYILAVHVPIAGLTLIPVLIKWPLILLPVHIVFLELMIDPACSVVFEAEPEEADVMARPPRRPESPLFGRLPVVISLIQGASALLMVLAIYAISRMRGLGETDARTLTFTTLIVSNLAMIFTNRSWSRLIVDTLRTRNAALWWVTGGAVAFLVLVLYVPFLQGLFHVSVPHFDDLLVCVAVGALSVLWFEILKLVNGRKAALTALK